MTRESAKLVAKLWLRRKSAMRTDDIPEGRYKAMIVRIRQRTDRNDHSEAIELLAEFVRDMKALRVIEAIREISNYVGSIPNDLYDLRNKLLKGLLKKASSKMSPEEYEALRMSF